MSYVVRKGNNFYYSRRVPKELRQYDPRVYVRIALKTDSRKQAVKLAIIQNEQVEQYWRTLCGSGLKHAHTLYEDAVKRTRLFGFSYFSCQEVAALPLDQILERLAFVEKANFEPTRVEAVLGGVSKPKVGLTDALSRYWEMGKDKILHKSSDQVRKWRNPRLRAVRNFVSRIGDKAINEITRDDMLHFRDWWLDRIRDEDLVSNSANKDFMHLRTIIETVSDNMKLGVEVSHLFRKLRLDEGDMGKRPSFTTDWLLNKLLVQENLNGLERQAKYALLAFAETGAGISELLGLLPEDINLNAEIPFIKITKRKGQTLKTRYRPREIPLVGFAMDAFKSCPDGFTNYRGSPDRLSCVLGSYLREHRLFPTEDHTVYSLRHSFQDRLLAANTPDRVQADLMGHKFQRQDYGEGASLIQRHIWMSEIQLKSPVARVEEHAEAG